MAGGFDKPLMTEAQAPSTKHIFSFIWAQSNHSNNNHKDNKHLLDGELHTKTF